MAYNKLKNLMDNIQAIRSVFELEKTKTPADPHQRELLSKYSGFGGLKCIMLPCASPEDIEQWNESEKKLFPKTRELFGLLKEYSEHEEQYKEYVNSLQSSVLTAFYTPQEIVNAIADGLQKHGIVPDRYLDPSAGSGAFLKAFKEKGAKECTGFENDLVTGKIVKALYPDDNIHVVGFETMESGNLGYFDVASSNIPFGNFNVFDQSFLQSEDKQRQQALSTIHGYFFFKALDSLREGGIMAFITSRWFMDAPKNTGQREWLMNHSNLLSAIRLPDNLFTDIANTEARTDLIILQKNTSKTSLSEQEAAFIYTAKLQAYLHENSYFINREDQNVIQTESKIGTDQYGKPCIERYYDGSMEEIAGEISGFLDKDLSANFDMYLYRKHKPQVTVKKVKPDFGIYDLFGLTAEDKTMIINSKGQNAQTAVESLYEERLFSGDLREYCKENMIVCDKGQIGHLIRIKEGKAHFKPMIVSLNKSKLIKDYLLLRDAYLNLSYAESKPDCERLEYRNKLKENYEFFIGCHGDLTRKDNVSVIQLDSYGKEALSLENYTNGHKKLADIFEKPVTFSSDEVNACTTEEALAASLNYSGVVDLSYMNAISGIPVRKLKEELAGRIMYNPNIRGYELQEILISGNVLKKSEAFLNYMENYPDDPHIEEIQTSYKALCEAIPPPVPFESLDFNFGERWISAEIYQNYAEELFKTDISITYLQSIDNFSINAKEKNLFITEQYAVKSADGTLFNGLNLMQHALVNTVPRITKTIYVNGAPSDKKEPDHDAIRVASNIIEQMREGFIEWLAKQSSVFKSDLEELYNRIFNSSVRPNYNGAFQTFPGLHLDDLEIKEIYDSQKDCVWMLKCNDGGIGDHEVGAGKTLIMCIAAYEMKRLGLVHKPIIIALNSNVHDIADTFSKAYPDANILYPGPDDFTPERRMRIFCQIKNNNWDCVILTHDQFLKIPQSLEIQRDIMLEELDALDADLKTMEKITGKNASKRMLKGLYIRKKNLASKLRNVNCMIDQRKDDTVDFMQTGIDHIFVDESHIFKNLTYTTRYGNVSGLGNPEGSQRALNMLYAIRTIQKQKCKDLCATFMSGTTISNSLVELYLIFKYLRPRALEEKDIRSFDSWAAVYARKTTDYEFSVTNEIIRKERFRYFIKVPELCQFYHEITDYRTADDVGLDRPAVNPILFTNKLTPDQEEFTQKLIEFARTANGELIGRPPLTPEEEKAKMLIATSYSRKMSLDMRLIEPYYQDHPKSKLSLCASNIAKYYFKYDQHKGTQFFFSDLGTYKKGSNNFNIYSDLKRKLVDDYSIPANEIRFIQECNNAEERKELFKAMNEGTVRILCGSTVKLGTGVNAQKRAVAIHHFDIPWKPAEMEQRNGRPCRPGNIIAKEFADNQVDCFIYATENTLDTYKFNILQNKQLFISQMKQNNLTLRTIDEGAINENGSMNFAEYVAIISGNTDLMDKAKLEKEIMGLENEQKAFNNNKINTRWKLENISYYLDKSKKKLSGFVNDWEYFCRVAPPNEKDIRPNPVILDNFRATTQKSLGVRLIEMDKNMDTKKELVKIGKLFKFDLCIQTFIETDKTYNIFSVLGDNKYEYTGSFNGQLPETPGNAAQYFISTLERLPYLIKNTQLEIDKYEKDVPILNDILKNTWNKQAKLQKLKQEHATLERKIKLSLDLISHEIEPLALTGS